MAKKKWYAVKTGTTPGIYTSWPETEAQVKGYPGARYKGFGSEEEARRWLTDDSQESPSARAKKPRQKSTVGCHSMAETRPSRGADEIIIYTDGGAIGNPGPGGYGVVISAQGLEKELSGGYELTTNNRMELMACIVALEALKGRGLPVTLYSDSSYVVNGMTRGWAKKWQKNGWRKADKKPVINRDLWEKLLELAKKHQVVFRWVKGHAGNPLNERCDRLAVQAAKSGKLGQDRGYRPQ